MQIAPRDHGGAEERHADHDEDLHLVGAEQRDAEQVAADHVGEIEQDREDKGERQRHFDDARDAVERLVDHRPPSLPAAIDTIIRVGRWGQVCAAETRVAGRLTGDDRAKNVSWRLRPRPGRTR